MIYHSRIKKLQGVIMNDQTAYLAGGCFWCLEAPFQTLKGVKDVVSGYMGGHLTDPDYDAVCTGTTGHAEVIAVQYDPAQISYRDLLEVFFALHDPTTPNRQGHDKGTQYRSVVFYANAEEQAIALEIIAALNTAHIWPDPVVTQIVPLEKFYPAEEYHQHYFERNPAQAYCMAVIGPKLAKLRTKFADKLKL
jgi:peptide-methionine (S)-S-oxide reductase